MKRARNKAAAPWVRPAMDFDEPCDMQILLVWRDNGWVVLRNGVEVGAYPARAGAIEKARALHVQAQAAGIECYMLVRELDGQWEEHPCPGPGPGGQAPALAPRPSKD